MATSKATLDTDQARRYMTLVSKHWSHRFAVVFTPEQASIDFGDSHCDLRVQENALQIEVRGDAHALPELEAVVLDHLQRFAPRDTTLHATWHRHD